MLGSTAPHDEADGKPIDYYELVGRTPFANDYEFEFARELIQQEKLGQGTVTDLLVISLSANDLTGHAYGPDSPQMHAMALALDRQIGEFLAFLQQQYGNRFWIALTADHGIAPTNAASLSLRIPAGVIANKELKSELNKRIECACCISPAITSAPPRSPSSSSNSEAFDEKVSEADAETYVAEAMRDMGFFTAYTKDQLAVRRSCAQRHWPHVRQQLFALRRMVGDGAASAVLRFRRRIVADHGEAYSYDQHVPLAFYGAPFKPGVYRDQVEPIDWPRPSRCFSESTSQPARRATC